MKIILIDDNQEITKPLSKFLAVKGHNCIVSNDGRNGLAMLQQQKFDVVLLDLAMPELTGFDIIDTLEKNGMLKETKVIVFSALAVKSEKIEELLQKGVHSCLSKPVKLDVLLKTIEG